MRRKKAKAEKHNTKIAVFFVIFVCLIILSSFIFRMVQIVGESKFDGSNRFTISVANNKILKILSFSPSANSISVINIDGEVKKINTESFLAIPIDGIVEADFLDVNKKTSDLILTAFLSFSNIETNLTIVDIFRLFLTSKTVPSKNVITLDLSTSLDSDSVDKIIGKLVSDERIEKEDLSIEIINATSVTGLGSRLGRFVGNMGGKVVQVSTDNVSQKKSTILYNGDKTYTLEKLQKILGFKLIKMEGDSIGDITIIIGEDSEKVKSF